MTIIKPDRVKMARGSRTLNAFALEISKYLNELITRQAVRQWETGKSQPRHNHVEAMCVVSGRDPNFFYGWDVRK